jgi:hypothetical protein
LSPNCDIRDVSRFADNRPAPTLRFIVADIFIEPSLPRFRQAANEKKRPVVFQMNIYLRRGYNGRVE